MLSHSSRYSSDDQENVGIFLNNLNPVHETFYRPITDPNAENFLLVHQTAAQKQLIARYGDEICLLDATYKMSRYSMPLFFLVVPTNTSYQVIASFIISKETSDAIGEALEIISKWNPKWKPANWMTDSCAAEINAIERVFPSE